MFGRILSIYDQMIILENNAHKVEASLIGVHIVFEEKYKIIERRGDIYIIEEIESDDE